MTRPSIDEHDCLSYLDGRISAHRILAVQLEGLQCDGAPDLEVDFGNDDVCRAHAYERALGMGFIGPLPLPISYQPRNSLRVEQVLIRAENGEVTHIADYGYGRAYFGPGEERSKPCAICGVETLVDGFI